LPVNPLIPYYSYAVRCQNNGEFIKAIEMMAIRKILYLVKLWM
jgi:hypothetical protein